MSPLRTRGLRAAAGRSGRRPGLRADDRGGATVEFVMWMPVFALLVMLCGDVAVLAYRYTQMWDVARAAVRDISVGGLPRTQDALETFVHGRLAVSYGAELVDAHTTYFSVEISAPAENLMAFGLFEAAFDGLTAQVASGHEPLAAW